MIKILIIILGLLFPNLPMLNQTKENIEQPRNAIVEVGGSNYITLYPKASFGGTSTTFSNLQNNILIAFNEGSVLQIDQNNGQIELNVKESDGTKTNIGAYRYNSNYTFTYNQTDYKGIMFDNNYSTNTIQINGTDYDYTYFLQTEPSTEISNFTTLYLITANNIVDQESYYNGYQEGLEKGTKSGYTEGQNSILNNLTDYNLYTEQQYQEYGIQKEGHGYAEGLADATENDFTLFGLISAIMTAPALFVKEAFNFEFFGINMANLLTFLLTLSIVLFIVGLFRKK